MLDCTLDGKLRHGALVEHDRNVCRKRFVLFQAINRIILICEDIDTSTHGSPTTFKTVTTVRAEESHSVWDDYPTDRVIPSKVVPADPNFPWGNDSPIHRHQNMTDVGIGLDGGGVGKRSAWRRRWENVKDKINSLWHGQALESED